MLTQQEIDKRIEALAQSMRQKGLAFSDMQARERAKEIVMQEVSMQKTFEAMKDDPSKNPQQRVGHIPSEVLKEKGMLTGDELPKDISLSELLKGKARK